MVIKVDGHKAVIVIPPPTAQEWRERLNWRAYKNNTFAGAGGMCGVMVLPNVAAERRAG